MRLCRFVVDETPLVGFYFDDVVVSYEVAWEAWGGPPEALDPVAGDNLLPYLPPDGSLRESARAIYDWLCELPVEERDDLGQPLDDTTLLVPIARPNKILLLAGNYPKHVEERGGTAAERAKTFPYVFMKPPSTTLTHPGAPIVIPSRSPHAIDWECELGVVIGRRARAVDEGEAHGCVAGYTVVNDITDRKFRPNPTRQPRPRDEHFDWLHGKWHDTFCPMGPCVLAAGEDVDPQSFALRLLVNDQVMQDGHTGAMIFPVAAIIAFISSFVTLEPGDIIATGTPAGVGAARQTFLKPGDHVRAEIEEIGLLANPVVAEPRGDD